MKKRHIFTVMLMVLVLAVFPGSKAQVYAEGETGSAETTTENGTATELILASESEKQSTDKQTDKKSEKEKSSSKSKTADDYAMSEVAGLAVIAVVTFGYFFIQNRKRRR